MSFKNIRKHMAAIETWRCCRCSQVNLSAQLYCMTCGKQRWEQLGLTLGEAELLRSKHNEST